MKHSVALHTDLTLKALKEKKSFPFYLCASLLNNSRVLGSIKCYFWVVKEAHYFHNDKISQLSFNRHHKICCCFLALFPLYLKVSYKR